MIRRINKLAENRIPFLLIVDFEMRMPVLFPLDELPPDIRFSTPLLDSPGEILPAADDPVSTYAFHPPGNTMAATGEAVASPMRIPFAIEPIPYTRYLSAFNLVRENALTGRTYLTNLTFPTRIRTRLSLGEIYAMSRAKYKLVYGERFVVFSPEIFVQIRDGQIRSFPMKGTIDAEIPGARQLILNDRKEMAEHVTIVDLIRNDLSIHASRVRVEKFRYIDTLLTSHKKLLQVSSVITGQLPEDYLSRLGEIIFSMLPAGSVSGAPKAETLRIIREAEGSDRGYYTGVMGFFNGKDFDSAVMIRFVEKRNGQLFYRSGGGITFLSDPEKEYRELIDKVYLPIA
jgi:para-aminobenzoate synthetase component 1